MKQSANPIVKRFRNADTFFEQFKLALEFRHAPDILRAHSPLAKPYFLNQNRAVSQGTPENQKTNITVDWGSVLCARIDDAALELWGESAPTRHEDLSQVLETGAQNANPGRYDYLVLELNYFKEIYHPKPKNQSVIYNDILHVSRATHDRHLRNAIEALGGVLLKQLRPTIRLEAPHLADLLIGRDHLLAELTDQLGNKESVSLVGAGGIGKTTLGAAIAAEWAGGSVFWFTIRPGLNDQLRSILFSLGYFLHQRGASSLWLQLVADEGRIPDVNLVLGLARADLDSLSHMPLICIDEVDLLRSSTPENENRQHEQILSLVESLRQHVPLMLIGQRAVVETNATISLNRLARNEIAEWLVASNISHTEQDVAQLDVYTSGNPRLLTLCFSFLSAIQIDGEATLADAIMRLPKTPGLVPIWERLRKRLKRSELLLLQTISVFRSPAPRDALGVEEGEGERENVITDAIAWLIERHLLLDDGAGGVSILPALQELIYTECTLEERETLHRRAATICASRGEYTEAAYHFTQGDKPAQAVDVWFPQMEHEIQRGQTGAAITAFEQVSSHRLDNKRQKQLALIRAQLYRLTGEQEKIVEHLADTTWPATDELSVDAFYLWGEALNEQGDSYAAQQKLADGLSISADLFQKTSRLHAKRGQIYMHERQMQDAQRQSKWARFHAEMLEGSIQNHLGHFQNAQTHYTAALSLAEDLDDSQAIGRTHYYIAISADVQEDTATAFKHFQKALDKYKESGNRVQEEQLRSNLAACHIHVGEHSTGIELAKVALAFFEKMKATYWCALNANNIAEAYFESGDFENAEAYAMQVVGYEETHWFPYGLYTLASVRKEGAALDEAQSLFTQACQISEENEDPFLLAYTHRALGETYAAQGNLAAANDELKAALALFQRMEIPDETKQTEALLAELGLN